MVIDADPTDAPFGKAIGLRRLRLEVGPIELFEQRATGDTEAPDRAFVVELPQQLADRGIEFSQTVEAAVAQAAEQPSPPGLRVSARGWAWTNSPRFAKTIVSLPLHDRGRADGRARHSA